MFMLGVWKFNYFNFIINVSTLYVCVYRCLIVQYLSLFILQVQNMYVELRSVFLQQNYLVWLITLFLSSYFNIIELIFLL